MDERAARRHLMDLGIGPLIKQRHWINSCCPFAPWLHKSGQDRKPSFGVDITPGKQSHFYCFTCKQTGRVHDLAAALGRLRGEDYKHISRQAFRDDLVAISDYEYMGDGQETPEPLDELIYGDLYEPATSVRAAMEYLEDRGISSSTARRLRLGYDSEDYRIVFSVKDRKGNLYGYTGRSILKPSEYPTARYPKVKDYLGLPKKHLLLGEERVQHGKPLVVVEGLFAYATLIELGVEDSASVVALLGSEMTNQKAERIQRINEPTYLLVDNDEAGDACLWGALDIKGVHNGKGAISKLVEHVPLFIPEYSADVQDVDDFTRGDLDRLFDDTKLYKTS